MRLKKTTPCKSRTLQKAPTKNNPAFRPATCEKFLDYGVYLPGVYYHSVLDAEAKRSGAACCRY